MPNGAFTTALARIAALPDTADIAAARELAQEALKGGAPCQARS